MPIEQCCVTPTEMRSIYLASSGGPGLVVHTVPADKVFVLTAWTMVTINNQILSAWLRRGATRVAFNRVWDTARLHNHLDLDPGVPFAAGEQVLLDAQVNTSVQHIFYGYEQDA